MSLRGRPVHWLALLLVGLTLLSAPGGLDGQVIPEPGEWTAWGRDPGGTRFAPLTEIDRENVERLQVAWVYRTGDLLLDRGRFQSTPLMVGGRLFVTSPLGRVSAVDPLSGREIWTFDPGVDLRGSYGDFANRGPAFWKDHDRSGEPCGQRVLVATIDARLVALDAGRGSPCPDFGEEGMVDLTRGLRNPPDHLGEYQVTSPPAVLGDAVVVGSAIADNQRLDAPSGAVRAFHARTGRLLWSWDPVPQDPSDPAFRTWIGPRAHESGAANAWAPLSVDPELGLVFVPTSSPSPDYFGGERLGRNEYANSVVALDGRTGELRWSFQTVRHDLWDYDIPAQPVLFPFHRDGSVVPAVAVATKMGHLFILDRRTGEPLHPVEERAVPASTVPGEEAWPTQPFPVRPPPLVPQRLDPDGPLGLTEGDRRFCRERIRGLRHDGVFTPPSLEGSVMFPGNVGGTQWGGMAVDPVRGIGVAPTNRLPFVVTLIPRDEIPEARRRRPGVEISPQRGTAYGMARQVLMAPSGAPCAPPPWGTLTAVDLPEGRVIWEIPLGDLTRGEGGREADGGPAPGGEEGAAPIPLGLPNMGGALITAGGVVFMAGTPDATIRAFDLETGEPLWRGSLPTDAMATPMTYEAGGRQFVVVASGGHDRMRALSGAPLGDWLVAFALPEPDPGETGPGSRHAWREPWTEAHTGRWAGEIRGGGDRHVVTFQISGTDWAELRATLLAPGLTFRAELQGERDGEAVRFTGDYVMGDECRGPVALELDPGNRGTLLVGRIRVGGPCFADREDRGTVSLRRPR